LHVQGQVRSFIEVVLKKRIKLLLEPWDVAWMVRSVAQTLLAEDAIEPLNEGLLILLIRSSRTNEGDMRFGHLFPLAFKLFASVPLDARH